MDGADSNIARETRRNPVRNVAVVGLLRQDSAILLVRTRRLPDHWQPIGGGVKPGDPSPRHALLRELREEVGLELDPADLRFEIAAPYDFGQGEVTFFSARMPNDAQLRFNERELADWGWYSVAQALNLPTFPATRAFFEHLLSHGTARDSCS